MNGTAVINKVRYNKQAAKKQCNVKFSTSSGLVLVSYVNAKKLAN